MLSFLSGDDSELDHLAQYAHALRGNAPAELKALERHSRSLNMYVNIGDEEGQVKACDELSEMVRVGAGGLAGRAIIDQGTLPSLVMVLQGRKTEPCRAAAALIAELCGGTQQRHAIVRSGLIRSLVALLRHADEPRLLREGARVLASLANEPLAISQLLREGAPRALKHLCRSSATQAHARAVQALGQLAQQDGAVLTSAGLPRVLCAVVSTSVLEARAAAAGQMALLMMLPSHRPAMLDAGCLRVLLSCCDSLNESLQLTSLHALSILLSGADMTTAAAAAASPMERAAQQVHADETRLAATQQMASVGGLTTLVGVCSDPKYARPSMASHAP